MSSFESPCSLSARSAAMLLRSWVVGLLLIGCSPHETPVQLRFMLTNPAVHRLQFYVHDVELLSDEDTVHPMRMENRAPWQSERIALLDFSSAAAARTTIEGHVPAARYTGVRFTVGVPFDLNHANQLTATAPLDRGDMFWSWQSGYKFLRLDLTAGEHQSAFHLGSTGCSSASALRPPQQPCAQPNLIHVELKDFDPLTQSIEIRVEEIVAALSEGGSRACTGDYTQAGCSGAFATTGLDVESGK